MLMGFILIVLTPSVLGISELQHKLLIASVILVYLVSAKKSIELESKYGQKTLKDF